MEITAEYFLVVKKRWSRANTKELNGLVRRIAFQQIYVQNFLFLIEPYLTLVQILWACEFGSCHLKAFGYMAR